MNAIAIVPAATSHISNYKMIDTGICPHCHKSLGKEQATSGCGVKRTCRACKHTFYLNRRIRTSKCLTCSVEKSDRRSQSFTENRTRKSAFLRVVGHSGLEPETPVLSGWCDNSTPRISKKRALGHSLINPSHNTDLNSSVQDYILSCHSEGKSPATIDVYRRSLRCFQWFCEKNWSTLEPSNITCSHIRQFLLYLTSQPDRWGGDYTSCKKPACNSTANRYYRLLQTFFEWLYQEGLIHENPLWRLKPPRFKHKIIKALEPNEVNQVLDTCISNKILDIRNKTILMMFLDTGLRVSELANLKLDDVDIHSGSILVRTGKGGKQRTVRIGSKARKALNKYLAIRRKVDHDYIFLSRDCVPISHQSIARMIRKISNKAGVKGVHVHRLRHTFAINYLRAGGDVFSLQYLLGHSTLKMTQHYLQSLNAYDAVKAHVRFSPVDNMTLSIKLS